MKKLVCVLLLLFVSHAHAEDVVWERSQDLGVWTANALSVDGTEMTLDEVRMQIRIRAIGYQTWKWWTPPCERSPHDLVEFVTASAPGDESFDITKAWFALDWVHATSGTVLLYTETMDVDCDDIYDLHITCAHQLCGIMNGQFFTANHARYVEYWDNVLAPTLAWVRQELPEIAATAEDDMDRTEEAWAAFKSQGPERDYAVGLLFEPWERSWVYYVSDYDSRLTMTTIALQWIENEIQQTMANPGREYDYDFTNLDFD